MNRHLLLALLTLLLIILPISLNEIQPCKAQDKPILGYPYDTPGTEGGEMPQYRLIGSLFTLNGDSTITSMSCKIEAHVAARYRYAIYRDNDGTVGTLIAQTEEGIIESPVAGQGYSDQWGTAKFDTPVSLQAGKYWLMEISETMRVYIHNAYFTEYPEKNLSPWNQSKRVQTINLTGLVFPDSFDLLTYSGTSDTPGVIAIYASGYGTTSVLPSPSPRNLPTPSRVFLNPKNIDSLTGKIEITGNLTSNNTGVPLADISFSYRTSNEGESDLHQFGSITTDSTGQFSIDWLPPNTGSYVINATYRGNSLFGSVFDGINILVSEFKGDKQVFSVESNSTVTSIVFDPQNSELNLFVTGQTNTIGFIEVHISKSIVGNISAVQAYIDGKQIEYTITETEDCWILQLNYHHSTHNIVFNLSKAEASIPEIPPIAIPFIMVVLVAVATILIALQKRKVSEF